MCQDPVGYALEILTTVPTTSCFINHALSTRTIPRRVGAISLTLNVQTSQKTKSVTDPVVVHFGPGHQARFSLSR